jgi:quercetin dioxygenase-like cupin family protein
MTEASTSTIPSFTRQAGEGQRRWFYGGAVLTWKASAGETGGAFLLWEALMEQGKVTPLHTHPDSDETFYVLEGEILVHLDGVEHTVGLGGVMVAPRGVPHAFKVLSPTARMLSLATPGCCEQFYLDASRPLADGESAGEVDFAKVHASAAKNPGIEILGPPPFPMP